MMKYKISIFLIVITSLFFIILYVYHVNSHSLSCRVYVSDRMTSCEEKGGKYHLYYSDWDNEYSEKCTISASNIKDF